MHYYVGIDIAKDNHYAAIVDSNGITLVKPFLVTNNQDGFISLLKVLEGFNKGDLLIGLEATSYYGLNIMSFFFNKGFSVAIINPLQTSSLRKDNIRKTKTDKVDSILVANTLARGKFTTLTKSYLDSLSLRLLTRFRNSLKKDKQIAKTRLSNLVNMAFPELESFFKDNIHIKTSYALLKDYSNPRVIASLNITKLSNLLKSASRGKYSKDKAIELKKLASVSIGIDNDSLSIQIKLTIDQIEFLKTQMKSLEFKIDTIINSSNNVLKSIKGLNNITVANIIGEIGDISRFPNSTALVAFAGLDPSINQSGHFNAKATRMSKRGSSLLRYSLIYASHNLVMCKNKTFLDYYTKKINEGKSHYNALGHCGKKLAHIIFKMLKDNVTFNLDSDYIIFQRTFLF